jgi:hypothetical protein
MVRFVTAACIITFCVASSSASEVSVFTLEGGGQLTGELLNPQESPRKTYVIRTSLGAEVTLSKEQVREVVRRKPAEIEYDRIKPTFAETVEGQWNLAEWCREQQLADQRKVHLQRVIELDPDHVEARRLLGYSKVDGQWKTQQQAMIDRGYIEYKGRWRLKQEVEIYEQERKIELGEKGWYNTIKHWRDELDDPNKRTAAAKKFVEIRDPLALPALRKLLDTERVESVRILVVEALARSGAGGAWSTLAEVSLRDPSQEVRLTALDYLDDQPRPDVVALYIQRLRDKDNTMVNRAAVGLQRMKDPSALAPLIDALVTRHEFKVGAGTSPDQYSASFGSGPGNSGSGFSSGGSAPRIVKQDIQNPSVLDALLTFTPGTNFNFDVRAWKAWLSTQRKAGTLDARRG